jgi:hypothetical protein
MSLFQVFHNLKNITNSNVFKNIKEGSIVDFYFKANGNYGDLRGFQTYKMLCTLKYDWSERYRCTDHYKYNFMQVVKSNGVWSYDRNSKIDMVVPIANDITGELYTCEIHDHGYVILEIRASGTNYYHPTTNEFIEVKFDLTNENVLNEEEIQKIKHEYGDNYRNIRGH